MWCAPLRDPGDEMLPDRSPGAGDERAFLEAFYAQLRAKLEGDMRFGKRKADKFS